MNEANKNLVTQFLCAGCVCGPSPDTCPAFKPSEEYGASCKGHILGTVLMGVGNIALGLPRGFCRPGPTDAFDRSRNKMEIRLWAKGTAPEWDKFNVPVWAMVQDGFLFIRTYSPRQNRTYVDVVEDGELPKGAINVGEFIDEID